jgi:hypothetical protein
MKIYSAILKLLQAGRQTDRETDMEKLISTFLNFTVNMSTKGEQGNLAE